jgi:hypothetical protein
LQNSFIGKRNAGTPILTSGSLYLEPIEHAPERPHYTSRKDD